MLFKTIYIFYSKNQEFFINPIPGELFIFISPLKNDKEIIETIRSVTNKPLYVDVNQGWNNKQEALEMIEWLFEKKCNFN